jgi:hypothetical protein
VPTLYTLCAGGEFHPYVGWIGEAWELAQIEAALNGWRIVALPHADTACSFNPFDAYAVLAREIGPVLLVGRLATSAVRALEQKLENRAVIHWCENVGDPDAIYAAILDVVGRHSSGHPEVPRRLAVALLLLAKLEHMHYWGGGAKNFMSVHKLAKGNGLDEIYKDAAHEVAQYLSADARRVRLLSAKLGDGYPKYACNRDESVRVYDFLRDWTTEDEQLMQWLTRDRNRVSVRELDGVRSTNYDRKR